MASKGLQNFSGSARILRALNASSKDPLTQCLALRFCRPMATHAEMSSTRTAPSYITLDGTKKTPIEFPEPVYDLPDPTVTTTIYKFPQMEPLRFESYDSKHLYLPFRRDLLHRAVIFEGDAKRQGTASSKTRWEVHGSHRKIRAQKGSGRARLGHRQSPMLVGGGKSFGPHPRNFSTELPKKVYDLAWRTALSWRYRRGELIVCEDGVDIERRKWKPSKRGIPTELEMDVEAHQRRYQSQVMSKIMEHNAWGKEHGRSLFILNEEKRDLCSTLDGAKEDGRFLTVEQVDVKALLELGRVVIEKSALDQMLKTHQSDLVSKIRQGL